MKIKNILKEACVESLQEAVMAEKNGADRLELCSRLDLDGLTPSMELIEEVFSSVSIPVKVMIRNREGDFCYSKDEVFSMVKSIEEVSNLGVEEIVIGAVTPDGYLDMPNIKILVEAAIPMKVTIHKCIDVIKNPLSAIEELKKLPCVTSILTSGQASTALEGIPMLNKMKEACGDHVQLIVAGKVTPLTLDELIDNIGATEYHGRKIVNMTILN